jgi:hypothetical protein
MIGDRHQQSIRCITVIIYLRNFIACCITGCCLVIVIIGMTLDCNLSKLGGTIPEFILLFIAFSLLFINEMYQVSLLGKHRVISSCNDSQINLYHSGLKQLQHENLQCFPYALKIRSLVYGEDMKHDHMTRVFLGQSFLVGLCTFLISQLTTFLTFPSLSFVPDILVTIFIRSGFSGVILTVNFVQLLPSILAEKYPVEMANTIRGTYSVIYTALGQDC